MNETVGWVIRPSTGGEKKYWLVYGDRAAWTYSQKQALEHAVLTREEACSEAASVGCVAVRVWRRRPRHEWPVWLGNVTLYVKAPTREQAIVHVEGVLKKLVGKGC